MKRRISGDRMAGVGIWRGGFLALCLLVGSGGCQDSVEEGEAWSLEEGGDMSLEQEIDLAEDVIDQEPDFDEMTDPDDSDCSGAPPSCAFGCRGDAFPIADACVQGQWQCPPGSIPLDECPANSCLGLPQPGEVCGEQGWLCEPDPDDYSRCPESMCLTCQGFLPEPQRIDGCECSCQGDQVLCQRVPERVCRTQDVSSLPGVHIEIASDRCVFTLDEVAAGVTFDYEIVVEGAGATVRSDGNAGSCGQAGDSGLVPIASVRGEGKSYCPECDTGLCDPSSDSLVGQLTGGRHPGSITWYGLAWQGPSDTGNEPSGQMPPGLYEVGVVASGIVTSEDGRLPAGASFEVKVALEIEVVP